MKNLVFALSKLSFIVIIFGCANIDDLLVNRKITLTQKQSSCKTTNERTKKYLTLSDDKSDSFREIVFLKKLVFTSKFQ